MTKMHYEPYLIDQQPSAEHPAGWIYRLVNSVRGLIEGDELARRHGIFPTRREAVAAAEAAVAAAKVSQSADAVEAEDGE